MKRLFFYTITVLIMFSCASGDNAKYNGLILTDKNTGKRYLLKKQMGDNYFIYEERMQIENGDTTYVFQ